MFQQQKIVAKLLIIFFGFVVFLAGAGCEKEVDIIPRTIQPALVVEATIENGQPPLVYLTTSLAYFDSLSVADLSNSFVRNAEVFIFDGAKEVKLKEYSLNLPAGKIFYYTIDSVNPAQIMIGKFGTQYRLRINASGNSYTAETRIPFVDRRVDSIWWQPAPNSPDTNRVVAFVRITDPKGFGNYIRYFTSVNDSAFLPGLNSVFDDKLVDGTTYDAQFFRGVNRNLPFDQETFGYFFKGEKVVLKATNIDKATYDFWNTWEQNQSNIGNPFGVPVKVLGNISGGALGYFGGYAVQYVSIQIPK
jgi:hypothetical protein